MIPDVIINLLIFLMTAFIIFRFARKDHQWAPERIRKAFRYFTCQSNVLCAAASLMMAVSQLAGCVPQWVRILKYMGTAAVTVTMLTVFLFLWPLLGKGGLRKLLRGSDFFLHLAIPLMAILTFSLPEKQGMTFPQCLWGLLPVVLYGPLYFYRTLYAPEGKRWDDFYMFNKNGKWPLSCACMLAGAFLICLALMRLQNI